MVPLSNAPGGRLATLRPHIERRSLSTAYLSILAAAVTYSASRARLASSRRILHESSAIQAQYRTPSRLTSSGPPTGRPC